LLLSAEDLQKMLPMPAAIAAMEEAFTLQRDDFQIPVRNQVSAFRLGSLVDHGRDMEFPEPL
jgi:hypothetical protein